MVQSIILWYLSRSIFIQCQFFYVLFHSHCLLGFAKHNEKCECDHALELVEVFTWNINERATLHPANSWITSSTNNYSHNCTVSQNCPFDLTHHTFTYPIPTHNVNLTGQDCCVGNVNKVSVLCLAHLNVEQTLSLKLWCQVVFAAMTKPWGMRSTRSATCRDCQTGQTYLNDLWRERANLRNICTY